MPENEFEKQVQQKLDGLKFDPSVEVWENVAAAVAKGKKDKRRFAIILLTLLLIGASFFILFNYTFDKRSSKFISDKSTTSKIDTVTEGSENHIFPKISEPAKSEKSRAGVEAIQKETKGVTTNANAKQNSTQQKSTYSGNHEKQNSSGRKTYPTDSTSSDAIGDVHNIALKQQHKVTQKISVTVSKNNAIDFVDEKVISGDVSKTVSGNSSPTSNNVTIKGQLTDSLVKAGTDTSKRVNDILAATPLNDNKKDTAVIKTEKSEQKSKWKLGYNFSFGATTTGNGYLGIGSGNNNGLYSNLSNSPATGNNSGQVSSIYTSSTVKPGIGIMVGLFIQKNISTKTKILFGLNYRIYSSVTINDTEKNTYDTAGNGTVNSGVSSSSHSSERYNNNFHFLELPVAMQFKLSKQNKLPVYLNTGISIAQLLGSNVQQFYASSGQYLSSKTPLNKTQFSLSAGLLFSLSRQAKNPFLIGPDLSFSVNKIANAGLYENSHYSYLGIMIQKTIGKK